MQRRWTRLALVVAWLSIAVCMGLSGRTLFDGQRAVTRRPGDEGPERPQLHAQNVGQQDGLIETTNKGWHPRVVARERQLLSRSCAERHQPSMTSRSIDSAVERAVATAPRQRPLLI